MMVMVAQTAGFCMGVKRAVDITKKAALESANESVYTLGELIHNKQVVAELEELGVSAIEELPCSGTVIIRAHGVTQECRDKLFMSGVNVIDATCPHVVSSQRKIADFSKTGGRVLILGDPLHPEVIGLCGYAISGVDVIDSLEAVGSLVMPAKFLFIAQTTFSQKIFDETSIELKARYPSCTVVDSICRATQTRQDEARTLASKSEVMVVVGGKNSANTLRLVEIGVETGCRVMHIERADELDLASINGCESVSITAGASTPACAVDEVARLLASL